MSEHYDTFARDYHYLSSIPLAPNSSSSHSARQTTPTTTPTTKTTTTRSRANPHAIQTQFSNEFSSTLISSSSSQRTTPIFPSPYENPSTALFPFTPGPLEISPMIDDDVENVPSRQTQGVESTLGLSSSPARPRRPTNPDLARIFGRASNTATPSPPLTTTTTRTLTQSPNPPPRGPLPHLPESRNDDRYSTKSPPPSHRKPVPSFLPTPPRAGPLAFDEEGEEGQNFGSGHPHSSSNRLSVGTFEGLLDPSPTMRNQPVVPGYRDQPEGGLSSLSNLDRLSVVRSSLSYDGRGDVVWSPRIHLGLDERGVEAREERIRQDQYKLQKELMEGRGGDLGDRRQLVGEEEARESTGRYLTPHTPSPKRGGGTGGKRQPPGEREVGPVGKRDIPFLSPRYRGRDELEDPEEVDQSGPVLRRGSKRLSDLASPGSGTASPDNDYGVPKGPEPRTRRKSRASTLQKMSKRTSPPKAKENGKKADPKGVEGHEVEVVVHDSASQDEGDVSEKTDSPVLSGIDEGDWERNRKEATCLAGRMNWSLVEFDNWLARFLHLFYPFVMFAHIPATIFLDFCLLYILCQVALYPAFPAANSALAIFARRAIIPVPSVAESTGWWVAVGVYAACTAVWLFGVCLWRECGRGYLRRWGGGGGRVQIEKVYIDAASFNYACARSYGTFSFMWQVRLAPLRPKKPLALAVEGSSRLDFVRETLSWYRQNWPTVLLLIPRAGISVALLLLYTTTAYGSSTATEQFASRDSAFFDSLTGSLTGFAAGVVLTNCVWAALRLVVVVFAWVGLWCLDRPFSCLRRAKRDEANSSRYQLNRATQTPSPFGFEEKSLRLATTLPRLSYGSLPAVDWKARRQRRLRAAILVCLGSAPLSSTATQSSTSPFLRSPYVLGAGSPWSTLSGKTKVSQLEQKEQEFEVRRRENLAKAGEQGDLPANDIMNSPPRKQGFWGKVSPFISPSATFHRSPIISFSRVSPSPPIGQASAIDSSAQAQGRGDTLQGQHGEPRLHRRVRSVPLEQNEDYLHFEEVPLSTRDAHLMHQSSGSSSGYLPQSSAINTFPSPPSHVAHAGSQYPLPSTFNPRPLSAAGSRLNIPQRPEPVSRFSAFSTKPSSSVASTPAGTAPLSPSIPFVSPSSPSGGLEAQLAQVPIEHLQLSDKLLSELRRVESYDRKARTVKKGNRKSFIRIPGFGSFSSSSREAVVPPPLPSPPAANVVDPTLRYSQNSIVSQPDSVGGQSEISTLRGAVKTPDLSRSLATFANPAPPPLDPSAIAHKQGGDGRTVEPASPDRPLLPPFQLSSDPRADNLSLGPATPVLGGTTHEEGGGGHFEGGEGGGGN